MGVLPALGISLKTTNRLQPLNALVGQCPGKVNRWANSEQKQRWLPTARRDIEARLRRIKSFRALLLLRQELQADLRRETRTTETQAA